MNFAALGTVIVLLGLAAWALRHYAPMRRSRQAIAVETAVPLGERRSLVIVAVEGRRLLLGLAPGHIGLVTELGPSFAAALDAVAPAAGETPARTSSESAS